MNSACIAECINDQRCRIIEIENTIDPRVIVGEISDFFDTMVPKS